MRTLDLSIKMFRFLQETTDMLETGKQESLKKGFLEYRKLKDVNFETHNEGAVIRYSDSNYDINLTYSEDQNTGHLKNGNNWILLVGY